MSGENGPCLVEPIVNLARRPLPGRFITGNLIEHAAYLTGRSQHGGYPVERTFPLQPGIAEEPIGVGGGEALVGGSPLCERVDPILFGLGQAGFEGADAAAQFETGVLQHLLLFLVQAGFCLQPVDLR